VGLGGVGIGSGGEAWDRAINLIKSFIAICFLNLHTIIQINRQSTVPAPMHEDMVAGRKGRFHPTKLST